MENIIQIVSPKYAIFIYDDETAKKFIDDLLPGVHDGPEFLPLTIKVRDKRELESFLDGGIVPSNPAPLAGTAQKKISGIKRVAPAAKGNITDSVFVILKDLREDHGLGMKKIGELTGLSGSKLWSPLSRLLDLSKIFRTKNTPYRYYGIKSAKTKASTGGSKHTDEIYCNAKDRSTPKSECKPNPDHPGCKKCEHNREN